MKKVLDEIMKCTHQKILEDKKKLPFDELYKKVTSCSKPLNFLDIFKDKEGENHINIIAEIKFASPSLGKIRDYIDPLLIAKSYLENGASALSVLTEEKFFSGSKEYLVQIRKKFPQAFLLRKDFIIDEYQIVESLLLGANAILLIASILEEKKLKDLFLLSCELGLSPLIEVHNEREMQLACDLSSNLIGINNRNLNNMKIDLNTSLNLLQYKPKNTFLVSESGIENSQTIINFYRKGFDAFLIGSYFMKKDDPGLQLKKMLQNIKF